MVTEYHPASVIWTQLIEVLQTKQTGTFFIATAENSSGAFCRSEWAHYSLRLSTFAW